MISRPPLGPPRLPPLLSCLLTFSLLKLFFYHFPPRWFTSSFNHLHPFSPLSSSSLSTFTSSSLSSFLPPPFLRSHSLLTPPPPSSSLPLQGSCLLHLPLYLTPSFSSLHPLLSSFLSSSSHSFRSFFLSSPASSSSL